MGYSMVSIKDLAPVRLVTEFLQKSSASNVREPATECSTLQTENAVYPYKGMSLFFFNISLFNCYELFKLISFQIRSTLLIYENLWWGRSSRENFKNVLSVTHKQTSFNLVIIFVAYFD